MIEYRCKGFIAEKTYPLGVIDLEQYYWVGIRHCSLGRKNQIISTSTPSPKFIGGRNISIYGAKEP
jgi:hypothetical protein